MRSQPPTVSNKLIDYQIFEPKEIIDLRSVYTTIKFPPAATAKPPDNDECEAYVLTRDHALTMQIIRQSTVPTHGVLYGALFSVHLFAFVRVFTHINLCIDSNRPV